MGQGAPKVTFKEQDLSFFIAQVTEGRNCMQITSRRGPVNEARLIGSMTQYREVYGLSIASSDSDLIAQRAFDRGAVLYINRVVHYTDPTDATTKTSSPSTLTLQNDQAEDTVELTASSDGAWGNGLLITITENAVDAERFDMDIIFPEQPELNESFTSLTMNNSDERYAVSFLNEQSKLVTAEDLESGNPFEGDTTNVDGTVHTAGTDYAVLPDDIPAMATNLASLINALPNVGAVANNNVVDITATVPGVAGNAIVLTATSNGDNITVSGAGTLEGGVDAIASVGTVTFGAPANGDTLTVDGNVFTKVGAAPAANEFVTIAELTALIDGLGSVNAVDDGAIITITAAVPGAAGDLIALAKTGAALTLSGNFLAGGADAIAATGQITFDTTPTVIDNPAEISDVAMAGGADGLTSLDDDDWIGDSAAGTGFHAFNDIDDSFGLASPEANSPTVAAAGIAYCESREDMVYYIDGGASVVDYLDALDFRKGTGIYSHSIFNSSYGSMYFGRPKVRSPKDNAIIDISPIGDIFGVHAFSDAKEEVWFAPAGLQRGRVPNTLGVHYNVGTPARQTEFDELSNNQINAIVDNPEDGTYVGDENTLQTIPSALQSLHIRRLLIFMRKSLLRINRLWLFEPNDPITWRRIFNLIDPFMADLLSRRAFYEYVIQCDQDARSIDEAILNTPEKIDQGIFTCRLFIKPTRTLKFFGIEAVISKSNANFEELLNIEL